MFRLVGGANSTSDQTHVDAVDGLVGDLQHCRRCGATVARRCGGAAARFGFRCAEWRLRFLGFGWLRFGGGEHVRGQRRQWGITNAEFVGRFVENRRRGVVDVFGFFRQRFLW